MTFKYKILDQGNNQKEGTIDAINIEVAISSLQKRGFSIVSITPEDKFTGSFLEKLWAQ